jgi:hypothetical protein
MTQLPGQPVLGAEAANVSCFETNLDATGICCNTLLWTPLCWIFPDAASLSRLSALVAPVFHGLLRI